LPDEQISRTAAAIPWLPDEQISRTAAAIPWLPAHSLVNIMTALS